MITNLKIPGLLIMLLVALPSAAQGSGTDANTPVWQRRCTTVALTTDTPPLPYRLIAPYFERRPDFHASKLILVADLGSADILVQLIAGTGSETRILVTNRLTGQRSSTTSDWTNYPGMVAFDAIEQVKLVCPGSVIEVPKPREVLCSPPDLVYRPIHTLAACSHTSWMANRDLYSALQSDPEVKHLSITLRPACSAADAVLEVSHNLDITVEWYWKLKSSQGDIVSAGHVIAYAGREAGARIADEVIRELAFAGRDVLRNADGPSRTQAGSRIAPRTLKAKLLPADFMDQDTSLNLFIDTEQVSARDTHGNLVFRFGVLDFRDAAWSGNGSNHCKWTSRQG